MDIVVDAAAVITFLAKWAWVALMGIIGFMFRWSHARHNNTYTKDEADRQIELRQAPVLEMVKQQKEAISELKDAIKEQTSIQRESSAKMEAVITALAVANNELKHK